MMSGQPEGHKLSAATYAAGNDFAKAALWTEGGLTSYGLKLIAMITMTIDHMALLWLRIYANSFGTAVYIGFDNGWDTLYTNMRGIGRLAFPIYGFLLVEGFHHTRSVKKYIGRLFILAIISEIPFDFMVSTMFVDMMHCNVMWTLLIALIAMAGVDFCSRHLNGSPIDFLWRIAMAVIYLAAVVVGYWCHVDYRKGGVACILLIYALYGSSRKEHAIAVFAGALILACTSARIELCSLIACIPVYFYKGERGNAGPVAKRVCNWYYPLHIFVLDLVAYLGVLF